MHSGLATKVALVVGSLFFSLVLIGIAELFVRTFTSINFLGNSKNLIIHGRFGESHGNIVKGKAMSFGVEVTTDSYGFRIDPATPAPQADRAILFLGDSVGFGCGVEEPLTAVGRLRIQMSDWRLYNSSSIGYAAKDYLNVVRHFLPAHPEVKIVYVLMCLNDITDVSAKELQKLTDKEPVKPTPQDLVVHAKRVQWIQSVNDWLRERSKLFLFIKNSVADTSRRYFLYDLNTYRDSEANFDRVMSYLDELNSVVRAHGATVKVIILPYEYQLRFGEPQYLLPQLMIGKYLDKHRIPYIDGYAIYKKSTLPFKQLFLFGDPMHFSAEGHKILFYILQNDIAASLVHIRQ